MKFAEKDNMNLEIINKVKEILTKKGIVFEEDKEGIKVSRDSIVNNIKTEDFEEDKYSSLIIELKDALNLRFYWCMKDDNWLFLGLI